MKFKKEIEKLNNTLSDIDNSKLIEKQHQKGKLGARERINLLLDENSFTELDAFIENR
ncbi:MAG: carboxyl transferase domain-containing protein, partial [Candidatus Pacearchaeota archaeon]